MSVSLRFTRKHILAGLVIYCLILFLVLYQYPLLGLFDEPKLFAGVPLFVFYIWVLNLLYIVITAIIIVTVIKGQEGLR